MVPTVPPYDNGSDPRMSAGTTPPQPWQPRSSDLWRWPLPRRGGLAAWKYGAEPDDDTDRIAVNGIDVTSLNAAPGFEQGLLVVHDEENKGGTTSNVKLRAVERGLRMTQESPYQTLPCETTF